MPAPTTLEALELFGGMIGLGILCLGLAGLIVLVLRGPR